MTAFVVTGTDTDVGKTVFAAALTGALGADYWKPVQSGLDEGEDADTVAGLAGVRPLPSAYRLVTPCSPHRAAEIDGVTIADSALTLPPSTPRTCSALVLSAWVRVARLCRPRPTVTHWPERTFL